MKLFRKMKDERVRAEMDRIYRIGFFVMTAGILLDLLLKMAGFRFSVDMWAGERQSDLDLIEFAVLMLAQIVCIVLMNRKGMMDDNAYAEAERFPWKHYVLQGVLEGVVVCAVVCAIQAANGAPWAAMGLGDILLVVAFEMLFLVPLLVAVTLLLSYASFRYAYRHRARSTAQEDGE
ncbi:MAG: hypothetical protein Q4D31_05875 [Eubacteriales bacterium]|nr:hypothetical protein [Eubacteriales bacterium]